MLSIIRAYLPAGSLRNRMARGTLWLMSGSLAIQALTLISGILCARFLEKTGFGQLNLLRSTVLMLGVLAGTGLGIIATRYTAEFRDTRPEHAGQLLGLLVKVAIGAGLLASLVCFALAHPIALRAMKAAELVLPLRIGSSLLLLNVLAAVQMGILFGFESFRAAFVIYVIDGLLILILVPGGAFLYGVAGAVGGSAVGSLLGIFVKYAILRRECARNKIAITFGHFPKNHIEIATTIFPIILIGIAFYPFEWLAKLSLARQESGFSQLGLFAAAYSMGSVASAVPGQLISAIQPFLSNLFGNGDLRSFRRLAVFGVLLSGGVASAIAALMGFLSKPLMGIYGAAFNGAAGIFVILCVSNVFYAISMPYYKVLIACGRTWTQALITLLNGITLVSLAYALRNTGAKGLALSYLFAYGAVFLVQTYIVFRIVGRFNSSATQSSELPADAGAVGFSLVRIVKGKSFRRLISKVLRKAGISSLFTIHAGQVALRFHPAALSINLWEDPARYTDVTDFFSRYLREGDTCVDVGANIGLMSLVAHKKIGATGLVYSIEAHPRIYRYLVENIKHNRARNVIPLNIAVGAEAGTLDFSDERCDDLNHVLPEKKAKALAIPVETLDTLVGHLQRIDLLKVDVEGYEYEVFQGAEKALAITSCIFFESFDPQLERYGHKLPDVIWQLKQRGFAVYSLAAGSMRLIQVPESHQSRICENLVALRNVGDYALRMRFSA